MLHNNSVEANHTRSKSLRKASICRKAISGEPVDVAELRGESSVMFTAESARGHLAKLEAPLFAPHSYFTVGAAVHVA